MQSLLRGGVFSPEEVALLTAAFEDCLRELQLVDRDDPAATLVAKRVLQFAESGVRDPIWLREAVLTSFKNDPDVSDL